MTAEDERKLKEDISRKIAKVNALAVSCYFLFLVINFINFADREAELDSGAELGFDKLEIYIYFDYSFDSNPASYVFPVRGWWQDLK